MYQMKRVCMYLIEQFLFKQIKNTLFTIVINFLFKLNLEITNTLSKQLISKSGHVLHLIFNYFMSNRLLAELTTNLNSSKSFQADIGSLGVRHKFKNFTNCTTF